MDKFIKWYIIKYTVLIILAISMFYLLDKAIRDTVGICLVVGIVAAILYDIFSYHIINKKNKSIKK